MTSRLAAVITAVIAALVLAVGLIYATSRSPSYESVASIVLAPVPGPKGDVPGLLDSYDRSGTGGTYVELLTSSDTLKQAGDPAISVSARAVPNTRTIRVTAKGDKDAVEPGLAALLTAAQQKRAELRDAWRIAVLQDPTSPERSGTPTAFLVIAVIALAIVSGFATWMLLTRTFWRLRYRLQDGDVAAGHKRFAEERPRYPVNR